MMFTRYGHHIFIFFFFSSRRRHTRCSRDWSSDVCSSDLPGLGGKTANLQWVYDHTGQNQKGKMVSLATETDRTLFFDFLPLDLGTVRGFKTRFHLYTVPGQVFYEAKIGRASCRERV